VNGALDANVKSVQTFVDNARPDTYKTHSKQGGAGFYYKGQSQAGQTKTNTPFDPTKLPKAN